MHQHEEGIGVFSSDDVVEQSAILNLLDENGIQGFLKNTHTRNILGLARISHENSRFWFQMAK